MASSKSSEQELSSYAHSAPCTIEPTVSEAVSITESQGQAVATSLFQTSIADLLPTEITQKIFLDAIIRSPCTKAWDTQSSWWKSRHFVGAAFLYSGDRRHHSSWVETKFPGGTHSGDPREAPWSVSRVCRRWRNIALATPRLWSYIEVDIGSILYIRMTQSYDYPYDIFGLALERSYPCGLDLVIHGILNIFGNFFQHLLTFGRRWERLLIPNVYLDPEVFKSTVEFPLLTCVCVNAGVIPAKVSCPRLQIWYSIFACQEGPMARHRSTITSYHCSGWWGGGRLVFIAKQLDSLHTFRIMLNPYTSQDDIWPDRITFPKVVDLSLSLGLNGAKSEVLTRLVVPSLKILHLLSLDFPGHFATFIMQSACSLTSLQIDEAILDSADLKGILSHTPYLEKLHLTFIAAEKGINWREISGIGSIDNEVINWLFDSHKTVVPRLERAYLFNLENMDLDLMLEILHQRVLDDTSSNSRLHHIRLTLPSFQSNASQDTVLRWFRCDHRLYIELEPWNLCADDRSTDGDSESEAQFTSSDQSSSSDDTEDDSEEDHELNFDWSNLENCEETESSGSDFEGEAPSGEETSYQCPCCM